MSIAVYGDVQLAHGDDVVFVRPHGSIVFVDVDSWRSAWRLLVLAWSQRGLYRRAHDVFENDGIVIATRFRGKEVYRSKQTKQQPKETNMADNRNDTQTWPDLAAGLYDKLTGRGAEINYEFENLEVAVPSRTGGGAEHASWKLNGAIRIKTQDKPKS